MGWKHIRVVRADHWIVATGAVANFGNQDAPRYCVSMFFVLPEWHGRRTGKALLDHLLALLREHGIHTCHVPSSRNAVGFYRKAGFLPDAVQPDHADEITWMSRTC